MRLCQICDYPGRSLRGRTLSKISIVIVILLIVCISIIFVDLWATPALDPSYDGRTLSDWVSDLPHYDHDFGGFSPPPDTVHAIRGMGSKCIPTLLYWLSKDYNLDTRRPSALLTEPGVWSRLKVRISAFVSPRVSPLDEGPNGEAIVLAFRVLGDSVSHIIPKLEERANVLAHPRSKIPVEQEMVNYSAFCTTVKCIGAFGPRGFPSLIRIGAKVLDGDQRLEVIHVLERNEGYDEAVASALREWSNDAEPLVQSAASRALKSMQRLKISN